MLAFAKERIYKQSVHPLRHIMNILARRLFYAIGSHV